MTKIDIISGFLGAGKTTFIKRLLKTNLNKEKVVLIENEFGEISIDGEFLAGEGIKIRELSQGCICCSLVGDFSKSLKSVIDEYNPERIIIEPSGVGKLSDVAKAVADCGLGDLLNSMVCIVDAKKAKLYLKNFGEFFKDQIENASTVVLSRTDIATDEQVKDAIEIVRSLNKNATLVVTPIDTLSDAALFSAYEGIKDDILSELLKEYHEHHHHDDDEDECSCEHHHHDDEDECSCEHNHHDDDEDECLCEHHHHDDDEDECSCGHHHHHHHGHDADEIFSSFGFEVAKSYDYDSFSKLLNELALGKYGTVVRSKGFVNTTRGWFEFNVTMEEVSLNSTSAKPIGKIVVIGSKIDEAAIKALF